MVELESRCNNLEKMQSVFKEIIPTKYSDKVESIVTNNDVSAAMITFKLTNMPLVKVVVDIKTKYCMVYLDLARKVCYSVTKVECYFNHLEDTIEFMEQRYNRL